VTCGFPGYQAARIFVDQATQDGIAEDPHGVEVGDGEVACRRAHWATPSGTGLCCCDTRSHVVRELNQVEFVVHVVTRAQV
jgi:hypothetical protein